MKRILVPIDRSIGLEALIETVRTEALAVPEGAVVHFFYAPTRFSPDMLTIMLECNGSADQCWSKAQFRALARLDPIAYSLNRDNVSADFKVSESHCPFPIWTIIREGKRWKADRLIIGIHSITGFKRWMLQILFAALVLRKSSPTDTDPGNQNERPQEVITWAYPKAA